MYSQYAVHWLAENKVFSKKSFELSELCNSDVYVIFRDQGKLYLFSPTGEVLTHIELKVAVAHQ
jgi:hypothetical protein